MTKNEIPVQVDAETGLRFVEVSGEVAVSDLSELAWEVEAIEGDCGRVAGSFSAHSVKDLDAIIAEMLKLRGAMAQAEQVCGE